MGSPVSWDRSYSTTPIPAEGRTYRVTDSLLRVLNAHMGSPTVEQIYTFDGVQVSTVSGRSFFDRGMVGGRLVLGNPGDSQFAIKFFSNTARYADPSTQSDFLIHHFSLNRGMTSHQTYCNVNPTTGDLVVPECADLTQAPEITQFPVRGDQVEEGHGVDPTAVPATLSVKARILLAAFGELPDNEPNRQFIRDHQTEIDRLRQLIEATQR